MKFYKEHYDVIIMGAGLAGLSAALQLQARGITDILILEKHNLPGGLATSYVRNGIEIEATLHEMMSIGSKQDRLKVGTFFDEMGIDIDWLKVPEAYRFIEKTKKIDMKRPFIMGGLLFGFYLLFVLAGALTTYTPATSLLKGIMVSMIAISSLSSFLYGAMINFGKKLGVIIDVAAVAGWQLTIPLGVMGVWTLNQNVRVWFVFEAMIVAFIWHRKEKKKAVTGK